MPTIIDLLHLRAISLDAKARRIGDELLKTDREFTRLRLEVVGRQSLDAWSAYYRLVLA